MQVNLSNNYLTNDGKDMSGVKAIADAIGVSNSLTRVRTFGNSWTVLQFSLLGDMVCCASHRVTIPPQVDLSRNMFGPEGAKAIAPGIRDSGSLTQVLAFFPHFSLHMHSRAPSWLESSM